MRDGWEIKTLGEVCDISAGQGAPQGEENYCLEGTPFIKAGNLEALVNGEGEQSVQKVSKEVALSHRLVLQKKGSIVFAKSGMSCMKGYIYTLQQDCYVVSHLAILFPKCVSGAYLNYALHFFKPSSLASDASFPSITLKDLALFPIPFPVSLEEQQRIVDILDQEFAKIDALKANAEKSLQAAKNLFQTILRRELVPIVGKNGCSMKPVVKLGDVCNICGGYTPKPAQLFKEGAIPYYKVADMNRPGNERELNYTDLYMKEARKTFPKGAIVFPKNGGAVATNKKRILAQDAVVDLNTGIAIPTTKISNQYLYYYFQGIDFKLFTKEGTLPVLRTKAIEELPLYLPSLQEQDSVVLRLNDLNENTKQLQDNYQKTLTLCDDLKQALLRKAFNGEL